MVLIASFAFVIFFGAPFVPTRKPQIDQALKLLALRPGQTLYELGAGAGGFVAAAASKQIKVKAYEINPLLYVWLKLRFMNNDLVEIKFKNFWKADFSKADGVYVFLGDAHMERLDRLLTGAKKDIKLASYTFKIPGKKISQSLGPVFLYKYKA